VAIDSVLCAARSTRHPGAQPSTRRYAVWCLLGGLALAVFTPATSTVALVPAVLLLVAAAIVYIPMLWAPGARGGDMVGLAFTAVSMAMTVGVLLGSVVALAMLWLRPRLRRRRILPPI
jgi:hypothetical protein